jgi:hypothetical protein
MTQIVSVITQEYALLVSDRLLTFMEGPMIGQMAADDECKLVSLCNTCGIGYSGLAQLGGSPTHEWIAKTLAAANCRDASQASQVLSQMAPGAIPNLGPKLRRQTFLLAGWAHFDQPPGLRSHFCVVTNALDQNGQLLAAARPEFDRRVRALKDQEQFLWCTVGQTVRPERVRDLERNLRRLVTRQIGPREALRLLVDEVRSTHLAEKSVGDKILGFCIPKKSVESQLRTGHSTALAGLPDEHSAAFTYFDPTYNELRQYGPAYVCGELAATDIQTEHDAARHFQSSQMRILSLPDRGT